MAGPTFQITSKSIGREYTQTVNTEKKNTNARKYAPLILNYFIVSSLTSGSGSSAQTKCQNESKQVPTGCVDTEHGCAHSSQGTPPPIVFISEFTHTQAR